MSEEQYWYFTVSNLSGGSSIAIDRLKLGCFDTPPAFVESYQTRRDALNAMAKRLKELLDEDENVF